jgi:chromosome segregation ATPase
MRSVVSLLIFLAFAASSSMLVSCDGKGLLAKQRQQRLEIERLDAELAAMERKPEEPLPQDRSKELEVAREELKATMAEISVLEDELAALDAEKERIENDFEVFQRKYKVRPSAK